MNTQTRGLSWRKSVMASVVVFLVVCLVFSDGVKGGWNLTKEEGEELERQLKIINKPAIKTIQNKDGDVIDCVDINNQPALDHPLLKNHSIQGRHISYPNDNGDEYIPSVSISKVVLKSARCPPGTIPIRRTTKEDLIRLKLFSKFGGDYTFNAHPLNYTNPPGGHWAVLLSDQGKYHGAKAWLALYNISEVDRSQYSGTGITIMNGADGSSDNFDVIVVGWFVHPALYGDTHARLTIFWTTDGYQHVKCFNHLCPGFIQKSSKYSLGIDLHNAGDKSALPVSIYMDKETGHWWFSILDGEKEEPMGYWPKYIFSSLDGYAAFIEWGGSVMSPVDKKSPPMGNGRFPSDGGGHVLQIHMVDEDNQLQDPRGRLIADRPDCYKVDKLANRRNFGWSFRYGGPGGCLG